MASAGGRCALAIMVSLVGCCAFVLAYTTAGEHVVIVVLFAGAVDHARHHAQGAGDR